MSEEEKVPEQSESSDGQQSMTRRQFLIGTGVGLVAGAAATAVGMSATAKPVEQAKPAAPTTAPAQPAQVQQAQPTTAPAPAQPAPVVTRPREPVAGKSLVKLNVNGIDYELAIEPQTTLVEVLKRDLGLTGTKVGCNGSMCSACTVLVEGVAQNSCSLLAIREAGKKIVTIEGLAKDGKLHPVQLAFWDNMGYQCGFCTPGQILGAVELLTKNKTPTEEQIRTHMSSHMCKCSAYPHIIKSVQVAAKAMA